MKRTIAPIEEDVRYLLDWLSTGLLWLGVTVTVHAVFWGIGRHWILMAISALFAAYVFLSSVLVHRRADRYRLKAKEEPPRHVNFVDNPSFRRAFDSSKRNAEETP